MPPRPFPLSMNTGVDICHAKRFEKYIPHHPLDSCVAALPLSSAMPGSRTPGSREYRLLYRLMDKVFTAAEQREFWRRFEGLDHGQRSTRSRVVAFLGGRWAAKEAIIKAYSPYRRLYMRDIEIWTQSTSTRPNNSAPVTTDAIAARDMPDTGQTGADTLSDLTGQEPSPQPYGIVLDRPRKEDDGPDRLRAEEIYSRWKATKPRILDAEGTLDLNAVCEALSSETPSRPAPSSPTGASASASASASSQQDAPTHSTSTILRDLAHRDRDINDTEGQTVLISISHDGEYCIATALAALPSSPTTHPPRSTRPSLTLFSPTILPPSTPKQTKRAAVTTTNSPTSTDVPRTHPPIATDSATGAAEAEAIVPRRLLSRVPAQTSGDGAKRRLGFRPQSPASTTSSPLPGSSSSSPSSSSPADDIVAGLVDRLWRKKP